MTRIRERQKGFTLVELLVVIIIIGILAAIAIPAFLNQRQKAADATLKSDLKNAGMVMSSVLEGQSWSDLKDELRVPGQFFALYSGAHEGYTPAAANRQWNNYPALPKINPSDGTRMELFNFFGAPVGFWSTPMGGQDFCINGTNQRSSYDAAPGEANQMERRLFYDTQLGGVVSIDRIVEKYDQGELTSCYGFAYAYRQEHPR